MSRLAQQVQAMTDELRRKSKPVKQQKGRTRMDDTENLGAENLASETHSEAVNTEAQAQSAGVDIEPDEAPAGAEAMDSTKKAAASKKGTKKTAAKKPAAKKAAAKAPKAAKAKAAKTPKAPKADAAPKVVIGKPVSNAKIVGFEALDKNQFVLVKFEDGTGVNLWPSGYSDAKQRIAARDAMAKRLSQLL